MADQRRMVTWMKSHPSIHHYQYRARNLYGNCNRVTSPLNSVKRDWMLVMVPIGKSQQQARSTKHDTIDKRHEDWLSRCLITRPKPKPQSDVMHSTSYGTNISNTTIDQRTSERQASSSSTWECKENKGLTTDDSGREPMSCVLLFVPYRLYRYVISSDGEEKLLLH